MRMRRKALRFSALRFLRETVTDRKGSRADMRRLAVFRRSDNVNFV
jgi:hypothetical protein